MNDEIETDCLKLLQSLRIYEAALKQEGNPLKRAIIRRFHPGRE